MKNSEGIKHCPFCRSLDCNVVKCGSTGVGFTLIVHCGSCGMMMQVNRAKDWFEAVAMWNHRTNWFRFFIQKYFKSKKS